MWESILVISVICAISAAVGFGVAYSRAKEEVIDLRRWKIAQQKVIQAMKKAVEREAHLRETFEEVDRVSSIDEFTRVYHEILRATGPR